MSKNIRNTNRYVINIDASLNDTAIATYSNSGLIPVTWNPPNIQNMPRISNIICERIGKMLYVTLLDNIIDFAGGSNQTINSPVGIIPIEYRPTTNQLTRAWTVNGYINPVVILQSNEQRNTFPGACILNTDGTLSFGSSLNPNSGPVNIDGTILTPFQGPNQIGFLKQTLVFSLE